MITIMCEKVKKERKEKTQLCYLVLDTTILKIMFNYQSQICTVCYKTWLEIIAGCFRKPVIINIFTDISFHDINITMLFAVFICRSPVLYISITDGYKFP